MDDLFKRLFYKKKPIEQYTKDKSSEANAIKNEIQSILMKSKNSMRKSRLGINEKFDELDEKFSYIAMALATGGKERIKK